MAKLTPIHQALALLLKELHPEDAALRRAVDNLFKAKHVEPFTFFDGTEGRVPSDTDPDKSYVVAMDSWIDQEASAIESRQVWRYALRCTCQGATHRWCKHRVRFLLHLAERTLLDAPGLFAKLREQMVAPRAGGVVPLALPSTLRLVPAELPEPPHPAEAWDAAQRPARLAIPPVDPDVQREIDELFPDPL